MRKFIPYGRQDISQSDIDAVVATLRSDFLTQGPAIEQFENALGEYLGAKHVIAVSNGTAGLHISYLAAGVGPGDAVIVPAITFAATSNAALYCGATPIFADVDLSTGEISPESVQQCVQIAKNAGLTPKAIAPVHYAGRPCGMKSLIEVAEKQGLRIIEDACHALGAEYRITSGSFQKVGSAPWTSMAVFSFHPVKHITTGEGGAVTTNNSNFAASLRKLRSHGITKDSQEFQNTHRATEQGVSNPWYMEMQQLGLNYRLCDIQAALGTSQTTRLREMIYRRREIALNYDKAFKNHQYITTAASDGENGRHSYHLYPLQIDFRALKTTRSQFMGNLRELGVGTQVHYIPVYWHPYYENNRKLWLADHCPNAESFYANELSIPMYSAITPEEQKGVIEGILKVAK